MYIHVWNEKMIHNGIEFRFCKCKNWLPVHCMGYKDTTVSGMHCREYLCLKCYQALPKDEPDVGPPLYTVEEFLKINKMSEEDNKNDKN